VIRTTNGGQTWSSSVTTPGDTLWFVDFVDQQEGYVISIEGEMYHSTDGGASWSAVQTGISNRRFYSLFFLDKNNGWLTGDSGSIYRFGTPPTGIQSEQVNIPNEYALFQNYPNPFNPSTMITYAIPSASHVLVKVYNLLGQEVATLVDAYREAGQYSVVFHTNSLSSGVYLYYINAGIYQTTKKMVLIK
jgi:hypothetical protein